MSDSADFLDSFESLPTAERLLALERIIPIQTVQEILQETGHAKRRCPVLPPWFMVFFTITLSRFAR